MSDRKTRATYSDKQQTDDTPPAKHHWLGPLATVITTLAVVVSLLWYVHNQIVDFDGKIAAINNRLDKLDSSVKIIADKQGGDTGNAVHEILGAALRTTLSGSHEQQQRASALVHSAGRLIEEMQLTSSQPSPLFFEKSAKPLSQIYFASTRPDLSMSTIQAMSNLAVLRSSADPVSISVSYVSYNTNARMTLLSNLNLDANGAPQPIDNVHWQNVEIRNSTILYSGGPLILENVRFVDCKFQFADIPRAFELLNIAVLGTSKGPAG